MGPDVSVCVATYRRPESLARLLESLARLKLAEGPTLEILIVDNDPQRSAAATARGRGIRSAGLPSFSTTSSAWGAAQSPVGEACSTVGAGPEGTAAGDRAPSAVAPRYPAARASTSFRKASASSSLKNLRLTVDPAPPATSILVSAKPKILANRGWTTSTA